MNYIDTYSSAIDFEPFLVDNDVLLTVQICTILFGWVEVANC